MKLYLMRHGLASDISVDPEQGLSDTGRQDVRRLADRLKQKGMTFAQVLHSNKARARQTAEIMRHTLSANAASNVHTAIKPNDNPDVLVADIDGWQQDTLIVSHLPFLPNLLNRLVGPSSVDIAFHPATVVCIRGDMDSGWETEWTESP